MKKSLIIVIVLVIIGGLVWYFGGNKSSAPVIPVDDTTTVIPGTATSSVSAPVSETTKVSDKLTQYKNEELGFGVSYPTTWELSAAPSAVTFYYPLTKSASNTVKKLQSMVAITSGKCAFPPVTTIKERSTLKNGSFTFNMISMSNSVQGDNYFDRMYSLQDGSVCYILSFSSITGSPAAAGLKGSEATQVANNNKAIVDAADQAFTDMVKSFVYVTTPAGQDEASVVPIKK